MYFWDQQVKKIKDPLVYLWVGKIPTFQGLSVLKRAARPDSQWRHRTDGQSLNTPRPLGVHPFMEFGFTVHFKYRIQKPSSMKTEPSGNTVEESLQCLQKPGEWDGRLYFHKVLPPVWRTWHFLLTYSYLVTLPSTSMATLLLTLLCQGLLSRRHGFYLAYNLNWC